MREVRDQWFKERRVADLDNIPPEVMTYLTKMGSDLGLGEKGRRIVARHKMKEEKEEKKAEEGQEEKVLSRKKRTAFNVINFDR